MPSSTEEGFPRDRDTPPHLTVHGRSVLSILMWPQILGDMKKAEHLPENARCLPQTHTAYSTSGYHGRLDTHTRCRAICRPGSEETSPQESEALWSQTSPPGPKP